MKTTDIVVEPCPIVVAYCDVTGFMSWIKKAAASQRDVTGFIRQMRLCFHRFRETSGYFTITTGDGMIAVAQMGAKGQPVHVLHFIRELDALQRTMTKLIAAMKWPRPLGFRVRITAGTDYKVTEPGPNGAPMVDFVGDTFNRGSRLLQVLREIPNIIHLSALEMMPAEDRRALIVTSIPLSRAPRDLDEDDLRDLKSYRVKGR